MVDMHIGACSCEKGKDGSPCARQSAVVAKYKIQSVNCFPSLSTLARQAVAKLAIGDKAKVEIDFYASIHQEKYEQDAKDIGTCDKTSTDSEIRMIMAKIRQNEAAEDNVMDAVHPSDSERVHKLKERLGAVKEDIEQKLEIDNHFRGVEKFLNRYESMQGPKSLARLSSSFHKFGWVFGGHTSSARNNSVFLRHGKRIPVQATAAGRRKYGSKGKGRAYIGRPPTNSSNLKRNSTHSRYVLPMRRKNKNDRKRPHSLKLSIEQGKQNAGKW